MSSIKKYKIVASGNALTYFFISEGEKRILKRVEFETTHIPNLFNLALGDVDPITRKTDFESESKNGDIESVFATVAKIIYTFTDRRPEAAILIQGNKLHKTRAYRMAISAFYEELSKDFFIQGVSGDINSIEFRLEEFTGNSMYEGFIVKRK